MPNKILTLYRIATVTLGVVLLAFAAHMVRNLPESPSTAMTISGDPTAGGIVNSIRPLMWTEFGITIWAAAGREPAAATLIAELLDDVAELEGQKLCN